MKLVHTNAAGLLLAVMLLSTPVAAWAQQLANANAERTYGTTADTVHNVGAWAFTGYTARDSALFDTNGQGSRYCSSPCTFAASVLLPDGALVKAVILHACTTSPTAFATAEFARYPKPEGNGVFLASPTTAGAQSGCGVFTAGLGSHPETIDNLNNNYLVFVSINGAGVGVAVRFSAVEIRYTLQVSPAPATATFTDVPTSHPFFPFVEALAAAGITTGCNASPPMYCPDDPVTRGQMAVFFSKALGLQFGPVQ